MNIHFSRTFFIVLCSIFFVAGVMYYFFARASWFYKVPIQNLSTLDTFLSEQYSFTLNLDTKTEEAIKIYCDETVASSTMDTTTVVYPCQNQNPVHKIVIGSADSSMSFTSIVKSIGNEELFWKSNIKDLQLQSQVTCSKQDDYQSYRNVVLGLACQTNLANNEKLYFAVAFIEPSYHFKKKVFIVVMNTSKTGAPEKVDQELLTLLSKKRIVAKESILGIFSFLRNSFFEVENVPTDSINSTEALRVEGSLSSSFITKTSGSDIDTTVCDASATNNCYPVYCTSPSAVWNYSLNKCIEPAVATTAEKGSKVCPEDSPIWDGSKCRVLTGNIISNNSCAIEENGKACEMKITWTVATPRNTIELRIDGLSNRLFVPSASGTISYRFPFKSTPHTVELYDGDKKLNDGKFVTECLEGGWDDIDSKCVNPFVSTVKILGEYYRNPGLLTFTCKNATQYVVRSTDRDIVMSSSTYLQKEDIPLTGSGNYSVRCDYGNFAGRPQAVFYNSPPPPPPTLLLSTFPQNVFGKGTTTLSWDIGYPIELCSLSARVICSIKECTASQAAAEVALNTSLISEYTDNNDPDTSRPMPFALQTIVSKTIDNGWKALGKKTLKIEYPTEFKLSCGEGLEVKKRVYAGQKQSKSNEQ